MSDGDVSLIRDEDVLRRMWQQTEDFSRKKEIRAHMYRLREERLRNLYSPEPSLNAAKGCEFSSAQGHVKSFVDQNFQSMKSKEVRDAGSPPKEFNYRGQDLKDLSNAGWNVESENKTTDDGHTRVKSVNANIEGKYDVDGGKGHFAAVDHHKQAVTEYNDGNTNLKRNEDYSNTSAHEEVVRQTGDGTHFTSKSSSSTSATKFEQTSSTHESVPYQINDNCDIHSQTFYDNNRNEEFTMKEHTTSNQDQSFRNDFVQGELMSRKIDYPDNNTKVIVETRCLPDGTKVTSTRREFRAPSVQTKHSEQIKSESKSTSYTSSHKKIQSNDFSKNEIYDESYNTNVQDIVDSQRVKDDFDFKNKDIPDHTVNTTRDIHYEDDKGSKNYEQQNKFSKCYDNKGIHKEDTLEKSVCYNRNDYTNKDRYIVDKSNEHKRNDYYFSDNNKNVHEDVKKQEDVQYVQRDFSRKDSSKSSDTNQFRESNHTTTERVIKRNENTEDTHIFTTSEDYSHISQENEVRDNIETRSSHQYQTTYQTDYAQRKISTDLSPSHQAWAGTLRSDTPPRSTARAASPGNKTYKSGTSSVSSLRSSVSPDKIYKKISGRGDSPNKIDRYSPTKTLSDQTPKMSTTQLSSYCVEETKSIKSTDVSEKHLTKNQSPTRLVYNSPERKSINDVEKRSSVSPDKETKSPRCTNTRPINSPQGKSGPVLGTDRDFPDNLTRTRSTPSPERINRSMEMKNSKYSEKNDSDETIVNNTNVEKQNNQPSYMRPTVSSSPKTNRASSPTKQTHSDRKSPVKQLPSQSQEKHIDSLKSEHDCIIKSENKTLNSVHEDIKENVHSKRDIIERQDTSSISISKYSEKEDMNKTIVNVKSNIAEQPSNQPNYIRPTVSNLPKTFRASSPTKQLQGDRKSPMKHTPSQNLESQLYPTYSVKRENDRFIEVEKQNHTDIKEEIKANVDSKCDVIERQETSSILISKYSKKDDKDETIINIADQTNNQPSYMRPTESSSPKTNRDTSPTKQTHSDRKSPIKQMPSQSLYRQCDNVKREQDQIIKEATREYITSNIESNTLEINTKSLRSSPDRTHKQHFQQPIDGSIKKITTSKRISPIKDLPQTEVDNIPTDKLDKTHEHTITDKNSKLNVTNRKEGIDGHNKQPSREASPIKRHQKTTSNSHKEFPQNSSVEENDDNKNRCWVPSASAKKPLISSSSLQHNEKTEERSPRDSASPTKPTSASKTLDFITTEIYNEEINKRNTKKTRTLQTPSTSPTRKLKSDETPSTGQSSPTTDSGFIYFSSKNKAPLTTEEESSNIAPKDSNQKEHQRTPSPTKVSSRSPSPEKIIKRENLPRKSSLKKPSIDNGNVISPSKPPTSFLISPDDQEKELIKDKLIKGNDKPIKPKPPLERRETYEERCRKILGMTEETSINETITSGDIVSPKSSPIISPCESPIQDEKVLYDDVYGIVDIVDLTAKTTPQETETKGKGIPSDAYRQKTPVKSVIDDSQTSNHLQKTIPNEVLQETKSLSDHKNEQSVNELNDNIMHENNHFKCSEDVNIKETVTEFITLQKEQEILDRVQSSLRKLSPDRKGTSIEDVNYKKCNSKLPILNDKTIKDECLTQEIKQSATAFSEDKITSKRKLVAENLVSKNQITSKPSSRNTSPIKKPLSSHNLTKNISETMKPRSTSPKKPLSPVERPQSPQVSKATIVNAKEPNHRPALSPTLRGDRSDLKKTIPKSQNTMRKSPTKFNATKTVAGNNNISQGNENKSPQKTTNTAIFKKEIVSKVARTSSDINIKSQLKKVSPQRMKSKPEIQLNNVTTNKIYKQTITKHQKSLSKEGSTKLPVSKPKSATALNTSMDDNDDVIIDVQQAKSSRENSPDRICPTPVGFSEDTGTPRFPDEVNEPDDEISKRSHKIIHEAQSIVEDIVEICEEDDLFVKAHETESHKIQQQSLATSNITKSNTDKSFKEKDSITSIKRPAMEKNLKSDECLLSVSEKVNKFAKGPVISKERSPSRNIKEEYDRETIYTDDYTKLSVNDKAHLFIETAENVKTTKPKLIQKPVRPDLSNVDESLKSDECLLSVSDKVNKFVKTAEHVSLSAYTIDDKEKKIQEEHEKIMKRIVDDVDENLPEHKNISIENDDKLCLDEPSNDNISKIPTDSNKLNLFTKQCDIGILKKTTLRSSEAVKKAKALFENIASNTNTKDTTLRNRTTKLTDIGVSQKTPRTKSKQPTLDPRTTLQQTDLDEEHRQLSNQQKSPDTNQLPISEETKDNLSINRATSSLPRDKPPTKPITREKSPLPKSTNTRDVSPIQRTKSPMLREISPISNTKSCVSQSATVEPKKPLSHVPVTEQVDSTEHFSLDIKREKSVDKLPNYQRPTMTSQMKEERYTEETEVSSRRGSGKFGIELRRTSADRSSVSSERRRSSVEHHQPCIEDIFDLDLLEQMLEKVVGYEQRRRIRAQIRVSKKKLESEVTSKVTRNVKQSTTKFIKTRSPERRPRAPEVAPISKKVHSLETQDKTESIRITTSSERQHKPSCKSGSPDLQNEQEKPPLPLADYHNEEYNKTCNGRAQSPEKHMRSTVKNVRQTSLDKNRPVSPTKLSPKTKGPRFSEYATAYMKKVGLQEAGKIKHKKQIPNEAETKTMETTSNLEVHHVKTTIDSTPSTDIIEVQIESQPSPLPNRTFDRNLAYSQQQRAQSPGKEATLESPSGATVQTAERQPSSHRSPSPETKRVMKKETKQISNIEKKVAQRLVQEEKPSWITNRNLKKVTSETRTFSSKKIETEKPKYRASSPSKAITKPIDVITSSYGPGPLDADGKPLFGIKALRNGATNYQVKGTVICQEFHSRNGSEPEGTISVTAYSTEPEDLEKLLQTQGEKPSRLHGLAAITTTKKFGGDTGTTFSEVATKEERTALDQFTHSDRRITESHIDTHSTSVQRRDQREKIEGVSNHVEANKTQNQRRTNQTVQSSLKKETRRASDQKETRSDRMQRTDRRVEDRKTVRQSSVKSLTEKFIKNASETTKTERTVYPKAGLILRTAGIKDEVSSDSSAHAALHRTDSEHSLASIEGMTTTTTTTTEQIGDVVRTTSTVTKTGGRAQERSFLDSSTKVTGVQDILTRMKNADIVIEDGDSNEDSEARALLNKFLGATVLMAGMQNYVTDGGATRQERSQCVSSVEKFEGQQREIDIEQCWDERELRKLLDECTDYDLRRQLRARIRALMAEQEACASAVTEALAAAGETVESGEAEEQQQTEERDEQEITNVTSSVRRNSAEHTISSTTVHNTKVTVSQPAPKPVSPFTKFRQLEKQNSINSPKM